MTTSNTMQIKLTISSTMVNNQEVLLLILLTISNTMVPMLSNSRSLKMSLAKAWNSSLNQQLLLMMEQVILRHQSLISELKCEVGNSEEESGEDRTQRGVASVTQAKRSLTKGNLGRW